MAVYRDFVGTERLFEFELLLDLARAGIREERVDRIASVLEGRVVDWAFVLGLARRHRLLPLLYVNAKKTGLQALMPEWVRENLYRRYLNVVGHNLRLWDKLVEVLELFASRSIPAVPFKGPVLAHHLYGDSALRCCQDLDILVPQKCAASARGALLESGFLASGRTLSGKQFEQVVKHGKEQEFHDRTGKVHIDLHWRFSGPFRRSYDFDFCRERLRIIQVHGHDVPSLSPEDTLLQLCAHGAHHIWADLEQVLSIANFMDRHPLLDWDTVQRLAGVQHCRRMLFSGLFLARDLFDAAVPTGLADQIQKDKAIPKIAPKAYISLFNGISPKSHTEKQLGHLPYYLKIREHLPDKALYLLRRIFVPTGKDWHNRPLDSRISSLYFLLRPLGLAVEIAKSRGEEAEGRGER